MANGATGLLGFFFGPIRTIVSHTANGTYAQKQSRNRDLLVKFLNRGIRTKSYLFSRRVRRDSQARFSRPVTHVEHNHFEGIDVKEL